jgi:hypothetical protein
MVSLFVAPAKLTKEAEPAGAFPMADSRANQGRRLLRVTYGPYVTQNRKEGPHIEYQERVTSQSVRRGSENPGGRGKAGSGGPGPRFK